MHALSHYKSKSGHLAPVYTIEIQTLSCDTDKLLDAVMQVYPLCYGRYERTASISAQGLETAQPKADSTTANHIAGFIAGSTQTYPMVELKITVERDLELLANVMDTILYYHHYEQPAIFVSEDWVSRSNYDPNRNNPNRWWHSESGLPEQLD